MSWLAKSVAKEAKQSPTVIYLPKSALLSHSKEIQRKTSLFFSAPLISTRKKTKYVCLSGSKPFESKVILNNYETTNNPFPTQRHSVFYHERGLTAGTSKSKSKYRYVGKIVWDITPTLR